MYITFQFQRFTGGLCNILVGCYQPDDKFKNAMVIVRVFGESTEMMVDRNLEKETFIMLSEAGFSSPLYCTFNNGMAYGFVKGEPLDMDLVKDENVRTLIAKEMAKMHTLKKGTQKRGDHSQPKLYFYTKMQNYLNLVPDRFTDTEKQTSFEQKFKSKASLQQEFEMLKRHLEQLTCDVVLCHNDLLLANIIYDSQTNKVSFIDFEYAFDNYQAFDIADHFNKYADHAELDFSQYPVREYQLSWIHTYLEEYYRLTGKQVSPTEIRTDVERLYVQVNKCALASHFFWGIWTLVQAELSTSDFDYFRYAVGKLEEYFKRRDEFLSLTESCNTTM